MRGRPPQAAQVIRVIRVIMVIRVIRVIWLVRYSLFVFHSFTFFPPALILKHTVRFADSQCYDLRPRDEHLSSCERQVSAVSPL